MLFTYYLYLSLLTFPFPFWEKEVGVRVRVGFWMFFLPSRLPCRCAWHSARFLKACPQTGVQPADAETFPEAQLKCRQRLILQVEITI